MKTLKIVFLTAAGKTMTLSLKDPKEDLDRAKVQQASQDIMPAMASEIGDTPSALKQASIVETSEVILQ
ncbi:MAG: DUF2922 domain-containing protein [Dialister sp.]|nr:DUF2922 domain-containing protein [Dialister sp.]